MADRNKAKPQDDTPKPVTEHLKELRSRVIHILIVLAVAFVVCLHFSSDIVTLLTDLGKEYGYQYVYIAPQELLLVHFSVAMIGAFTIAFPVIVYELYAFAGPGLTKKEQKTVLYALLFGLVFFLLGIVFAFKISIPFMLYFLISFTGSVNVTAAISIQEFISFVLTVLIIFGMIFEMPLVSVLLTVLHVIKPSWLKKGRKGAIVLIFLLAAIITPPDIASQIMVGIPMCLLYELSIILSEFFSGRSHESDQQKNAEE